MAIYITTSDPQQLLIRLNSAISSLEIVSWAVDKDGDYTINRDQWRYRAWIRPQIKNDNLVVLGIIQSRKYIMTNELYGVYHGRFVATVLAHFSDAIQEIRVTSEPEKSIDILELFEL